MKNELEENKNRGRRAPQEEREGHWEEMKDESLPNGCIAWIVIIAVLGIALLWGVLE